MYSKQKTPKITPKHQKSDHGKMEIPKIPPLPISLRSLLSVHRGFHAQCQIRMETHLPPKNSRNQKNRNISRISLSRRPSLELQARFACNSVLNNFRRSNSLRHAPNTALKVSYSPETVRLDGPVSNAKTKFSKTPLNSGSSRR